MAEHLTLPTVLVISDNPSVRYWLKKQLEGQFFFIEATTQAKALETVLHSSLHCIILDDGFKPCDFLQLTLQIRQTPSNLFTPILLITDQLKKAYRAKATEAGVTDFLFQPLDAEELTTKIRSIQTPNAAKQKMAGISARISAPKKETPSTFFKNKIVFQDPALQLIAEAKKQGVPVKMLSIRIDHFPELSAKITAETLADIVKNFTHLIKENVEIKNLISYSTDGQFILLLPEVDLSKSQAVAHDLQKLIEKEKFSTKQGIFHLTASFAISDIDMSGTSFNRMVDIRKQSLDKKDPP